MIYCIIGKSATGKDTILERLLENEDLNLEKIVPYTTRPKRNFEKDGREYHFVDKNFINEAKDDVVELRSYFVKGDVWWYATINNGQIKEDRDYITISTLESYKSIRDYYGEDNVYPIYIYVNEDIRFRRALKREETKNNPEYSEACRRYITDEEDFADDKIKEAGIDLENTFFNLNLDRCVYLIGRKILKEREK